MKYVYRPEQLIPLIENALNASRVEMGKKKSERGTLPDTRGFLEKMFGFLSDEQQLERIIERFEDGIKMWEERLEILRSTTAEFVTIKEYEREYIEKNQP